MQIQHAYQGAERRRNERSSLAQAEVIVYGAGQFAVRGYSATSYEGSVIKDAALKYGGLLSFTERQAKTKVMTLGAFADFIEMNDDIADNPDAMEMLAVLRVVHARLTLKNIDYAIGFGIRMHSAT